MTLASDAQQPLIDFLTRRLAEAGIHDEQLIQDLAGTLPAQVTTWTLTYHWHVDQDDSEDHGGVFSDLRLAQQAAAKTMWDRVSSTCDEPSLDEEEAKSYREIEVAITAGRFAEALAAYSGSDLKNVTDWDYAIEKTRLDHPL